MKQPDKFQTISTELRSTTNNMSDQMNIGNPPDGAKVPQYDFLEELAKLRTDVKAITIDGPSGVHFKKAFDRLLEILIDKL